MRMRPLVSAFILVASGGVFASVARAQACTPPARPSFEFQVERPAAYTGDTTRVPRPARQQVRDVRARPEVLLVQFVVDTLGVPDPRSFRVLQTPSAGAADSARAALPDWRFTPAELRGCRVPQVVQTVVTR
jgi:hypothetical protein